MRVITIKILDDGIYRGLRKQADENGRTAEEEASHIISAAVQLLPPEDGSPRTGKELYEAIRAIVEPLGGIELELPSRKCCEHVCSGHRQQ